MILCLAEQQLIFFLVDDFERGRTRSGHLLQPSKEEERMQMKEGCRLLKLMVLEVFAKWGVETL